MANRNGLRVSLAGLALLALSPLMAQSVHSRIDPSAQFSSYGTYSWTAPAEDTPDGQIARDAMNRSLAGLGWRMVPSGGDVLVTSSIGLQARVLRDNSGYPPDYGINSPTHYAAVYNAPGVVTKAKELSVTFVDVRSGISIWNADARWTSSRAANDPRRDLEDKKLEQVVGKVFQKLSKSRRVLARS